TWIHRGTAQSARAAALRLHWPVLSHEVIERIVARRSCKLGQARFEAVTEPRNGDAAMRTIALEVTSNYGFVPCTVTPVKYVQPAAARRRPCHRPRRRRPDRGADPAQHPRDQDGSARRQPPSAAPCARQR